MWDRNRYRSRRRPEAILQIKFQMFALAEIFPLRHKGNIFNACSMHTLHSRWGFSLFISWTTAVLSNSHLRELLVQNPGRKVLQSSEFASKLGILGSYANCFHWFFSRFSQGIYNFFQKIIEELFQEQNWKWKRFETGNVESLFEQKFLAYDFFDWTFQTLELSRWNKIENGIET